MAISPSTTDPRDSARLKRRSGKMKRLNWDLLKLALCALFISGAAGLTPAQTTTKDEYPKFEIFAGYSAIGEASGRGISFGTASIGANYAGKAGFETSLTRN